MSPADESPRGPARRRPRTAVTRRGRRRAVAAIAVAAVVIAGSGALAAGALYGRHASAVAAGERTPSTRAAESAPTSAAPTASATPTAAPVPTRATPSPLPAASPVRTCSVSQLASDARLGTLEAQVLDPATGQVLFDRDGSTPAATASVMKVLTSAAALSALGPGYRIPTTVVKGSTPGSVVLVGGGDVTLSRLPSGTEPFYAGAPHVDQLAAQVKQAWAADPANAGQPITSVVTDASLFAGPVWQPSWDEAEERVRQGSTAYVTALQVDGDRADPRAVESPRSTDPVGRAGQAFAAALGVSTVTSGSAPAGAEQLGQVLSQPVSTLIQQADTYSDNTLMETLARLVAIREGTGNTFSAEDAGTKQALATYGLDTSPLVIVDGSGLSGDDRVPPSFLTRLFVKVLDREDGLGVVYDALPVSGETGTLGPGYDRFTGSSAAARGRVNAKTGWIDGGYTLAGVVHAQDGTALTFAVFAEGRVSDSAKAAIDALVTGFYRCGGNLADS